MENQDLVALLMSEATVGDPIRYANLIRATRSDEIIQIREMLPAMKEQLEFYEHTAKQAREFRKQVSGDGYARRRKNSKKIFEGLDQQQEGMRGPDIDISVLLDEHYKNVSSIYNSLVQGSELIAGARMISMDETINRWSEELKNSSSELGEERVMALFGKAEEAQGDTLRGLAMEQQVNRGASTSFIRGLNILESIPRTYESYLQAQSRNFEAYYEKLRQRHSNGMVLCTDGYEESATLTDISLLVWENIDKVGEIENGHSKDELSAYTLHRANAMIEAAKYGEVWSWVIDPGKQLLNWVEAATPTIKAVLDFVVKIKQMLGDPVWRLLTIKPDKIHSDFKDVIESLDLRQITQRPPERAFSKTEKFAMEHRNKSVQKVADLLVTGESLQTIVDEILKLKIEERKFFMMENSFYVCKIGTGNMFTGEAPGAIEVIPGEKPNARLEHIWGSGFDEIKDFLGGIEEAKRWNKLFLATSPSESTDKNNILLVGPAGTGKTQVMRAVGADNQSISIFTVGSSFGTAWAHESQKNPMRLFDQAVKLHKSSGRHVYILIDEIDMILNNDRNNGIKLNLSLEFQNVMDGVVAYPGISIIGATNHPQRIPTPILRRFAKVLVVGELDQENIKTILKHYIENFLPCENGGFEEQQYNLWSDKLQHAPGDVIRKVVDEIWLDLIRGFIADLPDAAEKVLEFLNEKYDESFDISELSTEERDDIKKLIGEHRVVTPELVDKMIDKLLDNSAVQQQIDVAKKTFEEAKALLIKQKMKSSIGF